MTRGVKVGVRSVLLVMLLVPAFQRTPAPRCPVVPPRERDGARRPWRGMARRCSRRACCAFARSRSAGPSLTSWW